MLVIICRETKTNISQSFHSVFTCFCAILAKGHRSIRHSILKAFVPFGIRLWWLEMVNFIEVLEDIGCFGFWDVVLNVHVNLERIWH